MNVFDSYLEKDYGKLCFLDLHGLTLQEAKAELIHKLCNIDAYYNGLVVIHGYHKGRVLKDYIRKEFSHKTVVKKINLDASRTLLLVKLEK